MKVKWKQLAKDTVLTLTAPVWLPLVAVCVVVALCLLSFIDAYTE
jgi:hypothetical protein